MPNRDTLGKFGLGVPASKEENNDWGEAGFEQPYHKSKSVHLSRILGCCLSKTVVRLISNSSLGKIEGRRGIRESSPSKFAYDNTDTWTNLEGEYVRWNLHDGERNCIAHLIDKLCTQNNMRGHSLSMYVYSFPSIFKSSFMPLTSSKV